MEAVLLSILAVQPMSEIERPTPGLYSPNLIQFHRCNRRSDSATAFLDLLRDLARRPRVGFSPHFLNRRNSLRHLSAAGVGSIRFPIPQNPHFSSSRLSAGAGWAILSGRLILL
jgi:hypothetical protein